MEERPDGAFSVQPDSTVYVILIEPQVLATNDDGVVAFESFSAARENAQALRGQVRRMMIGELLEACRASQMPVVLVMTDGRTSVLDDALPRAEGDK